MGLDPSPAALWLCPPAPLTVQSDEVHVWRASLDRRPSEVRSLERTLVADERQRAERYRFQKDRDHFIVTRGLLRVILGRYLRMKPEQVRLRYGLHGKPALLEEPDGDPLRFNVSHSREIALFAVSGRRELGVDVEYIRGDLVDGAIAGRMLAPGEVAALRALPKDLQREAFFTCWTRKEAFIKATGQGLSLPLDRFEVSLSPERPAVVFPAGSDDRHCARWSLRTLPAGAGYAAALCVEGHDWRLQYWQWPES